MIKVVYGAFGAQCVAVSAALAIEAGVDVIHGRGVSCGRQRLLLVEGGKPQPESFQMTGCLSLCGSRALPSRRCRRHRRRCRPPLRDACRLSPGEIRRTTGWQDRGTLQYTVGVTAVHDGSVAVGRRQPSVGLLRCCSTSSGRCCETALSWEGHDAERLEVTKGEIQLLSLSVLYLSVSSCCCCCCDDIRASVGQSEAEEKRTEGGATKARCTATLTRKGPLGGNIDTGRNGRNDDGDQAILPTECLRIPELYLIAPHPKAACTALACAGCRVGPSRLAASGQGDFFTWMTARRLHHA